MVSPKPPSNDKPGFSRRFTNALILTRITSAMAQSDGWQLDQYTGAPRWLRDLYDRHAAAAHKAMNELEEIESEIKPSDHD